MTAAKIKADILINKKDFESALKAELSKKIIQAAHQTIPVIQEPIKEVCKDALYNSEFFRNILAGTLAGELGIPENDKVNTMTSLIRDIVETLRTEVFIYKNGPNLVSIKIKMQRTDYLNLFTKDYAYIDTTEGVLPWLHWVLFEGDNVIFYGYEFKLMPGKGRSGLGIMVETGNFKIDPRFAGTQYDNWITRALNEPSVFAQIDKIVENSFKKFMI